MDGRNKLLMITFVGFGMSNCRRIQYVPHYQKNCRVNCVVDDVFSIYSFSFMLTWEFTEVDRLFFLSRWALYRKFRIGVDERAKSPELCENILVRGKKNRVI